MKSGFYFLFIIVNFVFACASPDKDLSGSDNGKIIHIDSFPSLLINPRGIDIWLPTDYDTSKNYAVVYMHDAQMLFDSTTTWNNKEWMVDETMSRLLKEGKIKDAIIVGIENDGKHRDGEYFPESILKDLSEEIRTHVISEKLDGDPAADEYLMFIVHELKPYIDSIYSTLDDPANTFIMGSSMGGLISLYGICEYPMIFGGTACISTDWTLGNSPDPPDDDQFSALLNYLNQNLPASANHRIYFDYGTATLDSLYKPYQLTVDSLMRAHHYTSKSWLTKEFPGDEHSEVAWSRRLHIPLEFLLRK